MEEKQDSITNGKLKAVIFIQREGGLRITYYKQNGELLLQEIAEGGPRRCRSRHYKALPVENYRLKVSFDSNPEEKLYGMGQYQQERMDLKGCNPELAHRNSQASIPFCISSLGYGFLWHNPSVGEVHFRMNTTEWVAQNTKQMDYWITAGDSPAEPEYGTYEFENYRYAAGPAEEVGNIYPREYARRFYEGQKEKWKTGIFGRDCIIFNVTYNHLVLNK